MVKRLVQQEGRRGAVPHFPEDEELVAVVQDEDIGVTDHYFRGIKKGPRVVDSVVGWIARGPYRMAK